MEIMSESSSSCDSCVARSAGVARTAVRLGEGRLGEGGMREHEHGKLMAQHLTKQLGSRQRAATSKKKQQSTACLTVLTFLS